MLLRITVNVVVGVICLTLGAETMLDSGIYLHYIKTKTFICDVVANNCNHSYWCHVSHAASGRNA